MKKNNPLFYYLLFCVNCILFSPICLASSDFYQLIDKSISGQEINFSQFKDKVVLVVNIASECGFTDQLDGLQKLHQEFKNQGLVIIGVPSNEFGGQTPQDDQGMKEFCRKRFGVDFLLLKKGIVNGKDKRPLYKFLTDNSDKQFQGSIGWNFVKFLINKKGKVVNRFTSYISPDSKDLRKSIRSNLSEK